DHISESPPTMKRRPLVALSSAAILTVYAAGYVRTRSAAERFAVEAAPRRAAAGTPPTIESPAPRLPEESARPLTEGPRVERLRQRAPASTVPAPFLQVPPEIAAPAQTPEPAPITEPSPV